MCVPKHACVRTQAQTYTQTERESHKVLDLLPNKIECLFTLLSLLGKQ